MLSVDDIVCQSKHSDIVDRLTNAVMRSRSSFYRDEQPSITSTAIDLEHVQAGMSDISTKAEATATAKFAIRAYTFADKFLENAAKLALDPKWDGTYSYNGITFKFDPPLGMFRVQQTAVIRELREHLDLQPTEHGASSRYTFFKLADERLTDEHHGNPNVGILERALWLARRKKLQAEIDGYNVYFNTDYTINIGALTIGQFNGILNGFNTALSYKPPASDLFRLRNDLLRSQELRQSRLDSERRREASYRFSKYWQSLKDTRLPQQPVDVDIDLDTIPLLPTGTETSRSWGIEIETVRATQTSRPAGWESKSDGSLPNSHDGYCDCGCDQCYDGDHCNDASEDCEYDSEDSREFVSPVLSHFNSAGLLKICDDLGTDPDEATEPGIHVHVGAHDLSVFDVTRLLVSYSAIERLLQPMLHRNGGNHYFKPMGTDQLRWWLGKLREWRRANPNTLPKPRDIIYDEHDAAPDRYVDVNLHALRKFETIEFRAMGPWYDYAHLTRWAWILRELVNVSKLGIDQTEWTSCQTLGDVIAILRKYGTEMPNSQLFADVPDGSELSRSEL